MLKDNYTKNRGVFRCFLLANLVLTSLWHFIDDLERKGMLLALVKVEFPKKRGTYSAWSCRQLFIKHNTLHA